MNHGGNLASVREAANNRLQGMVNPALDKLEEILGAPGTTDSDKLKAITMVLNRTGYGEKNSLAIEHTAKPWEGLVDSILVDVTEDGQVIDGEVVDE